MPRLGFGAVVQYTDHKDPCGMELVLLQASFCMTRTFGIGPKHSFQPLNPNRPF